MPDNTNNAASTDAVTSKQEIPSSGTSADDKTPTEPSTTPEPDQKESGPEVSSASVGEVVLTPLKSPKEKKDAPASKKKATNTPKKAARKPGLVKKGKEKSVEVTRGMSVESAIPKRESPQATLSRQSTVSSSISTPGTPKKSVRLDISLDDKPKMGTPKKKKNLNRFRSKSPKKVNMSKMNGSVKKSQPLRSSTPKRSSGSEQKPKENQVNGIGNGTENESGGGPDSNNQRPYQREKSANRAPKTPRKINVTSTRPPKIKPRSQSPTKAKKGKQPSAWR